MYSIFKNNFYVCLYMGNTMGKAERKNNIFKDQTEMKAAFDF